MKTTLPAVLACLLLGLFSRSGLRGEEEAATLEEQVDELIHEYGVRPGGPGVAVMVLDAKAVRLKRCVGLANLTTKAPITPATTFELASVSKHFTGAAVLLLVQRGKVAVQDDVRKHLPELPAYDPEHPIRVDHLSRHTSGLPDYFAWDVEPKTKRAYYTNADAVLEFARLKDSWPLASVPGDEYDYSNSGYMVLAALVERVSGLTFGAFLRKELFDPFGMKTAWVHESPRVPTVPTAIGYSRDQGGWKATWTPPSEGKHEDHLTVGDGGVWASLDDMAAWDRGLRAGKYLRIQTLLGALTPGVDGSGRHVPYAMGWELEYDDDGNVSTLSHSGKWDGFETYIGHHVASEVTVVVLSNRRNFEAEDFGEAVGGLYVD
jgi:CubicO group peptidase (beta-lactamase class C family)